MAQIHRLKTWPTVHTDVWSGRKTFEIRKNDRGYSTGDFLVLDSWNPETGRYTDEKPLVRMVTYLMHGGRFGIAEDHVVMGIDKLAEAAVERVILEVAPPRPDRALPPIGGAEDPKR